MLGNLASPGWRPSHSAQRHLGVGTRPATDWYSGQADARLPDCANIALKISAQDKTQLPGVRSNQKTRESYEQNLIWAIA